MKTTGALLLLVIVALLSCASRCRVSDLSCSSEESTARADWGQGETPHDLFLSNGITALLLSLMPVVNNEAANRQCTVLQAKAQYPQERPPAGASE